MKDSPARVWLVTRDDLAQDNSSNSPRTFFRSSSHKRDTSISENRALLATSTASSSHKRDTSISENRALLATSAASSSHKRDTSISNSISEHRSLLVTSSAPASSISTNQGNPGSAYKRFRQWIGTLLRSRIKPTDVVLVRGICQPLLKDEELNSDETK
nr:uncharacterized protein LOC128691147 [Cherax quadricarinatus]